MIVIVLWIDEKDSGMDRHHLTKKLTALYNSAIECQSLALESSCEFKSASHFSESKVC